MLEINYFIDIARPDLAINIHGKEIRKFLRKKTSTVDKNLNFLRGVNFQGAQNSLNQFQTFCLHYDIMKITK